MLIERITWRTLLRDLCDGMIRALLPSMPLSPTHELDRHQARSIAKHRARRLAEEDATRAKDREHALARAIHGHDVTYGTFSASPTRRHWKAGI